MHAWFEGGGRVSARRPRYLFFASPKKSTQKKGDPQSATPSRCEGVNLHRVGCGVRRGTHCAAVQLRSDSHGESEHEARALRRACHPATAPTQAQPAGGGQPNIQTTEQPDIHSGHCCARPRLRSARRLRPRSGGRAKQWPVWMFCPPCPSGGAVERRVWRIWARVCLCPAQGRVLSETTSNPSTAGCPVAKRRGRRLGVAFSLVTFFWRSKRKLLARRATPGLRPQQRHAIQSATTRKRYEINSYHRISHQRIQPKNQNITPAQPPPDKPSSPQGQTPSEHAQPLPPTGVLPPPTPPWSPETRCCRNSNTSR